MKRRTVLLVALALTLLVSGVVLAQGGRGGTVAAQSGVATLSGGRYRLVSTGAQTGVIASGGRYRLASLNVQADVIASGGGYRLLEPAAPVSSENGCCCTFLPCVLRNH